MSQQRAELHRLNREKTSLTDFLDGLYREKSLIGDLLDGLNKKESLITGELGALSDSLAKVRIRLDSAVVLQENVVRTLYMNGGSEDVAFILGGKNFGDFLRRINLFSFLAIERSRYSKEIEQNRQLVGTLVDSTKALLDSVKIIRDLRQAELDSLTHLEKRKKQTLDNIINDEAEYRNAIARMEESLKELARRLPKPVLKGDFAKSRGGIPWPSSSRKIIHPFGIIKEKRFGTTFKNAGIDIATEPEEEVFVVADGSVAQIYWLRAYGQIVIIEHGGGYFTVYGNLGHVDVAQNQKITSGSRIGKTASDGWLEGAKLHFEIRNGRQEVNPLDWLVSA
ncbi:peptidoglycan DD-metalloendopeptidase family protein [bacterium]|nr:peptidoglycan DD-metalloendopeptidase family protein [bacterium]